MTYKDFRELSVWKKSLELAKEVYNLSKKLPPEELYALSSQMRRAAVSIPSNISEGQARVSNKEFLHFLSIARGSKAEIQTQLILAVEIGYLEEAEIVKAMDLAEEVGKMLYALMKSLDAPTKYI